jgi:hypothetical protein
VLIVVANGGDEYPKQRKKNIEKKYYIINNIK